MVLSNVLPKKNLLMNKFFLAMIVRFVSLLANFQNKHITWRTFTGVKCDNKPQSSKKKKMKGLFMVKEMSYWCLTQNTIFMVNPLWIVATFPDTNPHTEAFMDIFSPLFFWRHMCRWVSQELIKLWFLRDYPAAQLNFVRFTVLKQYHRISGWL